MRKHTAVPWRATLLVATLATFAFGCSGGAEDDAVGDVRIDIGADAEDDAVESDVVEPDADPDVQDDTCEGGNRPDLENACGGCETLAETVGDACGECDGGAWVCDGENALRCEGDAGLNACGGCEMLTETPGAPCGPCELDAWICDGENALLCDGATTENACGGCAPLAGDVGDVCGPCRDGSLQCEGEALECIDAAPGSSCAQLGAVRFGAVSGTLSDETTRVRLNAAPTTTLRTGNDAVRLVPAPTSADAEGSGEAGPGEGSGEDSGEGSGEGSE